MSGKSPSEAKYGGVMRTLDPRRVRPWLALVTLTAVGAAAAAGYALTAPKHYRATAQLLVSPVPADDTTFTGIDVLRDSGGRRTAAESATALVRTPLVADAVRALLGLHRSRDALLDSLDAHVVDASDVVAITVEDTSANGAAQVANAFADTLVAQRTASFQSEVSAAVRRYSQVLATMTTAEQQAPGGVDLARRLAALRALQGQPDPSLRHAGQATAPTSSVWPDPWELTGIGAGLGAAVGAAVLLALLAARRTNRRAPQEYDRGMSEHALEQLVDRLEARLIARESALVARERDVQVALDQLREAQSARGDTPAPVDDTDLRRREQELEERVAMVTKRERELARRAAQLAVRERELAKPEPEAKAQAAERPPPAARGEGYNLVALERLVESRSEEFPGRADEWSTYLFFLREHAAPDGSVPSSFDRLIEDAFAELLPNR